METDSYTPPPSNSEWPGTVADLGWMGVREEGTQGVAAPPSPAWHMPYPLGFQVSLTAFLMLELVVGFSSNLTVLVLYSSQSNRMDSVSNMVTVNLHVLDMAVCSLCLPLTLVVLLLPPGPNLALLCCFHEACVTFASIATAVNVLVISWDRYDISVRPTNRLLTPRRAALLLAAVWVVSLAVFFVPFLEFFRGGADSGRLRSPSSSSSSSSAPSSQARQNRTLLCVGGQGYHSDLATYTHLLIQVPIFFTTVAVMLFTYSRILRALKVRTGSRLRNKAGRFRGPSFRGPSYRGRQKRKRRSLEGTEGGEGCHHVTTQLTHPPLIPSPTPSPTATSPPALSSAPMVCSPVPVGIQASVSAIIALRRVVRRHRDRRERQRRVFRIRSLLIISSFLGCWAPLSMANVLILSLGPSDTLVSLRLWFLALAYGTTVSHPLLYAFTRQKLRRALRAKLKKRVVSLLQVDPSPGSTVIHNSWVEPKKGGRTVQLGASDAADRCLAVAPRSHRLDMCVTLPMPNQ